MLKFFRAFLNWVTPGKAQSAACKYSIWNFYYDAKLLQADNCIIITSNYMAWWSLNDLLVCLVSALGKTTLVEYIFVPRHDISKWLSYATE